MYSLKAISYEEARLQHFEYQLSRAKNRLKWAVDRRLEWESGERGAEVSYYQDVVDMLKREAEPVRHGRWEFDGSDFADIWKCTACGEDWYFEYDPRDEETRVNYCPNCGAKMDKENP